MCDLDRIKEEGLEIIDANIVRHIGMTRLQSKQSTSFQDLLLEIEKGGYVISDEKFQELAKLLFFVPPKEEAQVHTISDRETIDAYNDNLKRFFESIFAKKILTTLLAPQRTQSVSSLIEQLTAFLMGEYATHDPDYLQLWQKAKRGEKELKDESLVSFANFRPDLQELIDEDHFANNHNPLIGNLYDLHYMTHHLQKIASYQGRHPDGIFEIYRRDRHRNGVYRDENRGRIHGFGFNYRNPSLHLGIFRSIDKVPYDMRKPRLTTSSTRCPDNLYMEHP